MHLMSWRFNGLTLYLNVMNKHKLISLIGILIIATAIILLSTDLFDSSVSVSYKDFKAYLYSDSIESATITSNKIKYTLKSDSANYSVDNPQSQNLVEELLLHDVIVKTDNTDINAIGDMVFNIFFFALILFGGYKLLSWYTNTFRVVRHTGVTFDDVAGLDDLKKEIKFTVELMKNKKEGIRNSRGIILEGPPGNGKTLFAKALAEECGVNFIATKGADFQGAIMGLGAFKVKMLFNKAKRKKPCIIFIDEFDSIGEKRSYAGSGIDKENNRIITTLLNEMDGFSSLNGVIVIAATNSYQSLDAALVRPGRFDLKYTISAPDKETRRKLIDIYTKEKPLAPELTKDMLVNAFNGLSSAAIESILNEAISLMVQNNLTVIDAKLINQAAIRVREKLK